jgi:hypothetical protein
VLTLGSVVTASLSWRTWLARVACLTPSWRAVAGEFGELAGSGRGLRGAADGEARCEMARGCEKDLAAQAEVQLLGPGEGEVVVLLAAAPGDRVKGDPPDRRKRPAPSGR